MGLMAVSESPLSESPLNLWEEPLSSYTVTSGYGWRPDPFTGEPKFHRGIDLDANTGDTVEAARSGTVSFASWDNTGYGNLVIIDHGDGIETLYAHLSSISVNVGEQVNSNTKIGEVGSTGNSTGPHLHFEVHLNGVAQNPRDYVQFA